MDKITTFLLNLIKLPTQIVFGGLAIAATVAFSIVFLACSFLMEVWPLGALVLAWYFWW